MPTLCPLQSARSHRLQWLEVPLPDSSKNNESRILDILHQGSWFWSCCSCLTRRNRTECIRLGFACVSPAPAKAATAFSSASSSPVCSKDVQTAESSVDKSTSRLSCTNNCLHRRQKYASPTLGTLASLERMEKMQRLGRFLV